MTAANLRSGQLKNNVGPGDDKKRPDATPSGLYYFMILCLLIEQ